MLKALSLSLALLLLVSCRQTHSPVTPALDQLSSSVPNRWTESKEARAGIDGQWVRRFKDTQLNALVAEAADNNRSLKASAERLRQAQQRSKIAASAGKPQLGIGANASRQSSIFLGFPGEGAPPNVTYNAFGVAINASWELDLWGRIRAGKQAEIAAYEALGWQQRAAQASLQAQVCKSYFALLEANQQQELAQQAVEILTQTRDVIADRFNSALSDEGGSGAQYRLAETDLALAQSELSRWQGLRDSAARQLELILGRYPSATMQASAELPKLPATPPVGLPSELLRRRPDILSAERRYAESLQRIREAELAVYPVFSLTGSGGTSTTKLSNILNSDFGVWSLAGGVAQSILTGGRISAEKIMRDRESNARLIELHDTVLQGFGEVEQALASERVLRKQYQATAEAVQLAADAKESADEDYRSGVSSVQNLLQANSALIRASSTLVSLQRLALDNRINLHLALGGDFTIQQK